MRFLKQLKRKTIVTGHYGSGKTEFALSLAMIVSKSGDFVHIANTQETQLCRTAIIDLDVVNPYFRSRERRQMLEHAGISVYGSVYEGDVTAEIPELGATVRTPLEDKAALVIADLGGNDSGALIINQFAKYFADNDTLVTAVVNANRPATSTLEGVLEHIGSIESVTGLHISQIINNTHMLRETTYADIEKGHMLCLDVCSRSGKSLLCDCYAPDIVKRETLTDLSADLMPLGLYMRPNWLDR